MIIICFKRPMITTHTKGDAILKDNLTNHCSTTSLIVDNAQCRKTWCPENGIFKFQGLFPLGSDNAFKRLKESLDL